MNTALRRRVVPYKRGKTPSRKRKKTMKKIYPIIYNTISMGEPAERMNRIMAAVKAVEKNWTDDSDLVGAVNDLEDTLDEYVEKGDVASCRACKEAEQAVLDAYTPIIEAAAEESMKSNWSD